MIFVAPRVIARAALPLYRRLTPLTRKGYSGYAVPNGTLALAARRFFAPARVRSVLFLLSGGVCCGAPFWFSWCFCAVGCLVLLSLAWRCRRLRFLLSFAFCRRSFSLAVPRGSALVAVFFGSPAFCRAGFRCSALWSSLACLSSCSRFCLLLASGLCRSWSWRLLVVVAFCPCSSSLSCWLSRFVVRSLCALAFLSALRLFFFRLTHGAALTRLSGACSRRVVFWGWFWATLRGTHFVPTHTRR